LLITLSMLCANTLAVGESGVLYDPFDPSDTTDTADTPLDGPAGTYLNSPLGSAKLLVGVNLVVTIFVNFEGTTWNERDIQTIADKYRATEKFLEAEAQKYEKELDLLCDFQACPDLCYTMTAGAKDIYETDFEGFMEDRPLTDEQLEWSNKSEELLNDFVKNNIPYPELAEKYGTDSIVYIFQVPKTSQADYAIVNRIGLGYAETNYHEKVVQFNSHKYNSMGTLPHELLHTFGAADLYCHSQIDGVSAALMDYVKKNFPNEIMGLGNNYEIGRITAYGIGWLDDIPELSQFPELWRYTPALWYDHTMYFYPGMVTPGNVIPPTGGSVRIDGYTALSFTPDHAGLWIVSTSDCGDSKILFKVYGSENNNKKISERSPLYGGNALDAFSLREGETIYILATFENVTAGDKAKGSYTLNVGTPEALPGGGGKGRHLKDEPITLYYFTPDSSGTWEIRHSDTDGADGTDYKIGYTIFAADEDGPSDGGYTPGYGIYSVELGFAYPSQAGYSEYITVQLEAGQTYLLELGAYIGSGSYTVTVSKKP